MESLATPESQREDEKIYQTWGESNTFSIHHLLTQSTHIAGLLYVASASHLSAVCVCVCVCVCPPDCPQVQAIYDYKAAQPDELSLERGDVVKVYRKMADG